MDNGCREFDPIAERFSEGDLNLNYFKETMNRPAKHKVQTVIPLPRSPASIHYISLWPPLGRPE
jgi:hypothetical protein